MTDRSLMLLADRVTNYWDKFTVDPQVDWPLITARSPKEFSYFLSRLAERGDIDPIKGTILPAGWERIERLRSTEPNSRQAFVAMWFDSSMDEAWVNGIKPGIEDTGAFDALRVDQLQHNEKIDDRIVAEIRRSGLLVADFTGNRGGVYFEAGFAMGLAIPVIWTCRSDAIGNVHFDTRQYNHIAWETPQELRRRLRDRIDATITPSSAKSL
jgi:hypothetical protein